MAIPDLYDAGYLPVGIHDCTWDEVQLRFGGSTSSSNRALLITKLAESLAELHAAELASQQIGTYTGRAELVERLSCQDL